MDKILIRGGRKLNGAVTVSGSKNASLPILFASLLASERIQFSNVPSLHDIRTTKKLLETLGASVQSNGANVSVYLEKPTSLDAPYDLVRTMRASVLVLGPLLARFGRARVSLPGGCAIGARPVDLHLSGLEKLGAEIKLENGYIEAIAKSGLKGALIHLDFPSVGATENLMMAATMAVGVTEISNAAQEPEIESLAEFLNRCGAKVMGAGSPRIRIEGVKKLSGCEFKMPADRIEAGTFLAAGLATGGTVRVNGISAPELESTLVKLEEAGAIITRTPYVEIKMDRRPKAVNIRTQPFPGFATDMQAQLMAAMCIADGTSTIEETIFENRFMHVPELCRMGASIQVKGNTALVTGIEYLTGAPVMATDLRASVSLVIAGLVATGETVVNRVYHLDRGYENLEEKFRSLGADITRISDEKGSAEHV